jgi:uncharacterized protein YjeT (DUF2065 family)
MNWADFWAALASERVLRNVGLVLMIGGLLFLYLVRV